MKEKLLVRLVLVILLTSAMLRMNFTVGTMNESSVDWWPMFRHDLSHRGYSTSTAPNTNNTIWSYTTGATIWSSPAVVDGIVYIGSFDNKVYALDAATGALIWSYTTGDDIRSSSPAVADGKVYIGSRDGRVYALNAATGALIWTYTTGSYIDSSPAVADGIVYIGSWDDKVYALNAATGALIWSYRVGWGTMSSPAVADGKVYIGTFPYVYALDAATGALIWSYKTDGGINSSPAVADGIVYIGSFDNKVYALNATTGTIVWSYDTGSDVHSCPAVADGKVYIGFYATGKLCALNATTGALIWSYTTRNLLMESSPAVADGKVYIGSLDRNVYALDAATGALIWSYTTGNYVRSSSPAVADGVVYIGSDDGKVYAFGPPPPIPATLDIDPDTLNLRSEGQWITAYIQLPEGYNAADINASTILLNGTISPVLDPTYGFVTNSSEYLVDHNNDGVLERLVKFDRATVESWIYHIEEIQYGNVALTVTGQLFDGTLFEGTDTVFVNYAGDINNDGTINILDAAAISAHWYPGPPIGPLGYDPNADLNNDGTVNIFDAGILNVNWGQTTPPP